MVSREKSSNDIHGVTVSGLHSDLTMQADDVIQAPPWPIPYICRPYVVGPAFIPWMLSSAVLVYNEVP